MDPSGFSGTEKAISLQNCYFPEVDPFANRHILCQMKKSFLLRSSYLGRGCNFAADHKVTVSDFQFTPATVTARVGDTISWTWQNGFDVAYHDLRHDTFGCRARGIHRWINY